MNTLEDICGRNVSGETLDALRKGCQSVGQAFGVSVAELVLMLVCLVLGAFAVLAARQREGVGGATLAGNVLEGAAYGAIGAYAGSVIGLLAAEVVPPRVTGTVVLLACVVAVIFACIGLLAPDADGDTKGAGFLLAVLLAVAGVAVAVVAWTVPTGGDATGGYRTYLNVCALAFGAAGALDGIAAALSRGPHWAVGAPLVFLNSSWGFLGNLLGLGARLGSSFGYARDGSVVNPNRKWYTLYRRGMTMKRDARQRYAFTQSWVISCDQPGEIEAHERWHVAQHLILGPSYVISQGVWYAVGAVIGFFCGLSSSTPGSGVTQRWGYAITAWSYFNNPYEIWAYATHAHGARQESDTFIIASPWSRIFAVLWIAGFAVALTALVVHWT